MTRRPSRPPRELVTAVREFLERDVMPATEGRVQFHTRVAVNVLGIGRARAGRSGPSSTGASGRAPRALLGHDGDRRRRSSASSPPRSGRARSTTALDAVRDHVRDDRAARSS